MASRSIVSQSILSTLLFGEAKPTSKGRIIRFDKSNEPEIISPIEIRSLIISCLSDLKKPATTKKIAEIIDVKTAIFLPILRQLVLEEIIGRMSHNGKKPVFFLIPYIRASN